MNQNKGNLTVTSYILLLLNKIAMALKKTHGLKLNIFISNHLGMVINVFRLVTYTYVLYVAEILHYTGRLKRTGVESAVFSSFRGLAEKCTALMSL